jgi:phosphate transport system substrate-binding protein
MKTRIFITFTLLVLLLLTSCGKPKQVLRISGSTTVLPVISKAAEIFQLSHPNVIITVNAGGSGVGFNQVANKTVQIGMMSREISKQEISKFSELKFTTHTVGRDAVACVVSSEVYSANITSLSLEQIKNIYNGSVKNWIEYGGPDRQILVIDKEHTRGTRHVFMKAVLGNKKAEAAGADLVLGSNNEEQTALAQSDSAIGMLSFAWVNSDVRGVAIISETSKIEPTKKNVIDGLYPISRNLNLVTFEKPKALVREFIDFIKSENGQQIIVECGYVKN